MMNCFRVAFTAFALAGTALTPTIHAVTPAPDGGYPGDNTAEGSLALLRLNGGTNNTAVGWASLGFNVIGNLNTAAGAATLVFNTADGNTATGAAALLSNTTGFSNTANGTFALFSNTTGSNNTAMGYQALGSNVDGFRNNGFGLEALSEHHSGSFNNAFGALALASDESGASNNAFGDEALRFNVDATNNTAMGDLALHNNNGSANTAVGSGALTANTSGQYNTSGGLNSLNSNTVGSFNTAIGAVALFNSTTGGSNTALGYKAGLHVGAASNVICIGADVEGADIDDSCYIGNIWNQPGGAQAVYVNSDGKLGLQVSARRFKDEVKPMGRTSQAIYGLKPVSFRYKPEIESTRPLGFGLIAEEVEEISPDLVTRSSDGKPNSVRYDAVNAMLLNEFLKEHRVVQEQGATIIRLQKQIEKLTAGLQKLTTQTELHQASRQTVLNND